MNIGWAKSRQLLCLYFVGALFSIIFVGANQDEMIPLLLAIFSFCASPSVIVARLYLPQKWNSITIGICTGLLAPLIAYGLLYLTF
jgi:hypothetical protein